jgi:hypothetical protein
MNEAVSSSRWSGEGHFENCGRDSMCLKRRVCKTGSAMHAATTKLSSNLYGGEPIRAHSTMNSADLVVDAVPQARHGAEDCRPQNGNVVEQAEDIARVKANRAAKMSA